MRVPFIAALAFTALQTQPKLAYEIYAIRYAAICEKPSVALQRAGLKPEDFTDVVISHIHSDHADGFDLYPKAKDLDSERRAGILCG